MKFLQFAAVVFVLYFLGYVLGPHIAPVLISEKKAEAPPSTMVVVKGTKYEITLSEYDEDELPRLLKITKETSVPTLSGAGEKILKKGASVTLLRRDGEELVVETEDLLGKGSIKAEDTDLFRLLAEQKYLEDNGETAIAGGPAPVKPQPVQPQTPPDMPVVAQTDPPPVDPTPPAVDPAPEPEPEPTPPAPTGLSAEEIVALMKKDIEAGAIKEITMAQVKDWQAGEDEVFDGTEYQIGLVTYEGETFLGVKKIQAKALIENGKVERWIYANSGAQIR